MLQKEKKDTRCTMRTSLGSMVSGGDWQMTHWMALLFVQGGQFFQSSFHPFVALLPEKKASTKQHDDNPQTASFPLAACSKGAMKLNQQ